ncbi:MAG: hypothetical protein ACR2QK_12300 [Acidimicrobiales bacterium]
MILALSLTTLWPILLLSAAFGGLASVFSRLDAKGRRVGRSVEQEIGIYDRAHEIYARLAATADPGRAVRKVSEDLVMVAALHACGAIDDHQFAEVKGRIITA